MLPITLSRSWWITISLALISLAAGVVLLVLSGWFISACALAGLSSAAYAFNYVIPSAVIRLLAFTRILSSYGEKYVGHDALLKTMNNLRLKVFDGVMQESSTKAKSEEMERVVSDTHQLANWFLAVISPLVSAALLVVGLILFMFWLIPEQALWLVSLIFIISVLGYWRFKCSKAVNEQRVKDQARYRDGLSQQLHSASVWSLNPNYRPSSEAYQHWRQSLKRWQQVEYVNDFFLLAVALVGVMVVVAMLPGSLLGNPLLVCLPLLLLAFPDWLGQAARALFPAAQALQARENSREYLLPSGSINSRKVNANQDDQETLAEPIQRLSLQQVAWQRGGNGGEPVTTMLTRGDLVWLQGSSGSGKSSLMLALIGLLPHCGTIAINHRRFKTEELASITPTQLVYSEQFPQILADTLRQNLLLASPQASDQQLLEALNFAELSDLAEHGLDQWLGEQGRLLSGGEQKRLGLARAYLSGATVWLLDEPFAAQDEKTAALLAKRLEKEKAAHIILVASHRVPDGFEATQTLALPEA